MLVRLLVAVLMLTGSNPARVCTCAASASQPTNVDPTGSKPANPTTPERSGCGCRDKAATNDSSRPCGESSWDAESVWGCHSPTERQPHDPHCPAVSAPPVVCAIPTPAPDVPAESDFGFLAWCEPQADEHVRSVHRVEVAPFRPAVPLYISLLTLRN